MNETPNETPTPRQASLFDLPEPERIEPPAAELPEAIKMLLDAGCPVAAAQTLMEKCGGLQVRIPDTPRLGQLVTDRCGIEVATHLAAAGGGLKLNVPKGFYARIALRNVAIRKDFDAGLTIVQLVDKYNLTTNALRVILGGK